MITTTEGCTVITGEHIAGYIKLSQLHAMRSEERGFPVARRSVCAHVKRIYNLKGARKAVIAQFEAQLRKEGVLCS